MFERNHVTRDKLSPVAHEILKVFPEVRIFAFYGEMGSGKTTFIREICQVLHSPDMATSPSFSIINEYRTRTGDLIYHFDFYRIKDLKEAFDLGYEDYFYSDRYCFIEWPERIEELLPGNHLKVLLIQDGENTRTIKAQYA